MPDHVQPPRVRLTLRVGVAGSRRDVPAGADVAQFRERVQAVLRLAKNTACDPRAGRGAIFTDEGPLLRVISTLADDADQIIVDSAVREFGYELQCVLPFIRPPALPAVAGPLAGAPAPATVVMELDGDRRSFPHDGAVRWDPTSRIGRETCQSVPQGSHRPASTGRRRLIHQAWR